MDLPDASARAALFQLHLKKRGRDASTFDVSRLAASSEGFSGAEIEQCIIAGLYTAFDRKQKLTTEILLSEIAGTQQCDSSGGSSGDPRVVEIARGPRRVSVRASAAADRAPTAKQLRAGRTAKTSAKD